MEAARAVGRRRRLGVLGGQVEGRNLVAAARQLRGKHARVAQRLGAHTRRGGSEGVERLHVTSGYLKFYLVSAKQVHTKQVHAERHTA